MIRDLPLQRVFAVSAVRAVLVAHDEHVSVGDVPRSELVRINRTMSGSRSHGET